MELNTLPEQQPQVTLLTFRYVPTRSRTLPNVRRRVPGRSQMFRDVPVRSPLLRGVVTPRYRVP